MGLHTTYLGHVLIRPALNEKETTYLRAFNASRRWDRPDGPFAVPLRDTVEEVKAFRLADDEARNRPAPGQPQLWCPWVPCREGHCLSWDGGEKPYAGERWLRYLIDTFLRFGATARTDRSGRFGGFGFDHTCDGLLVGEGRESGEVFALDVAANLVRRRTLMPGLSQEQMMWGEISLVRDRAEAQWVERRARRKEWLVEAADEADRVAPTR